LDDSIALEKFIRDKYEHKRYFKAVDKPTQVKIEVSQGTVSQNTNASVPVVNTSTILQPPRSTPNLTQPPRSSTPQRTRQTESVMVDPFSSSPAQPVKQDSFFPVGQQIKPESHILFNPNVPQQPVQAQPPMAAPTSAVDMNLLKKSNIMSMFDVQTEQQKMYYTGAPQQQQQMYYASPTPQLYYTASGSFVPVMYSPQAQMYSASNVVYYPQPASQ